MSRRIKIPLRGGICKVCMGTGVDVVVIMGSIDRPSIMTRIRCYVAWRSS